MKLSDFKINNYFFTATGRWMTIDIDPNGDDGKGTKTPIVYAIPIEPNEILDKKLLQGESLITEFYDYDFDGCDLKWDRFRKSL